MSYCCCDFEGESRTAMELYCALMFGSASFHGFIDLSSEDPRLSRFG